jgi:hypothetical protein
MGSNGGFKIAVETKKEGGSEIRYFILYRTCKLNKTD